jgi:hypothetical protein
MDPIYVISYVFLLYRFSHGPDTKPTTATLTLCLD